MDMDKSRFCSGLCNAALKSTSTSCDAKDANEALVKTVADDALQHCSGCWGFKTVADDALQHCSGCWGFYNEYLVACDVAGDGERAPVKSLTRFIMFCIYVVYEARAPAHGTHSHTRLRLRLTSARAPFRCGSKAQEGARGARAPGPGRLRRSPGRRRRRRKLGGRLQRRVQLCDQVCVHWLRRQ